MKYKQSTLRLNLLSLFLLSLPFLFSCKKETETPQKESFLEFKSSIGFTADGGQENHGIRSSSGWKAVVKEGRDWISCQQASQTSLEITAKPNTARETREGVIAVSNQDGLAKTLKVVQLGSEMELIVPEQYRRISIKTAGAPKQEFEVMANTEYKIIIPEEAKSWIELLEESAVRANLVTYKHAIKVAANTSTLQREAEIQLIAKTAADIRARIIVQQAASSSDPSEVVVPEDVKLRITSGKASEAQPGQGIERSFDGQKGQGATPYHSIWSRSANFPVVLEYFFQGNTSLLDYIIYHSRNGNGNFGRFDLFIKEATDADYIKIGEYDFKMAGGSHRILLTKAQKVPVAVKFEVHSGLNNFVSCDEMEFFHSVENPVEKQLAQVFSSQACTALKESVSEEALEALPSFFRNLALSLRENTYPEEEKRFRIQEYKAYSVPEHWASVLKINPYTHLNNPTGIITEAGEEMIVLADGIGEQNVSLHVCPGIGHQGPTIPIVDGINKLHFSASGSIFVYYEVQDPRSASPITVHFPPQFVAQGECARVGYNLFDLAVDKTDEQYRRYLAKTRSWTHEGSPSSIFILKGRKTIFTVLHELMQYQEQHKGYGVTEGLKRWDNIMDWEQELCGIDGYARSGEFNNLMHVTTFKDGLYATHYYINMAAGNPRDAAGWGFKNNFDPRDMDKAQDNQWGVGHELGHMHQGAINWPSTTESSNNLFSNYVVYKIDKWGSRGSSINQLAAYRFAPPTSWVRFKHPRQAGSWTAYDPHDMSREDANKHGLYQGEDSEMHMRLNQQLWTYFERCGFQPDFFKTVFQIGRTAGKILPWRNPGQAQLQYAKNVAEAAQMDMTEFFDCWGFFIPVQRFNLHAYGNHNYVVTEEMIADTKAFMKQFSRKAPPIQYIEDREYRSGARGNQKGVSESGGDVGYFTTFKEQQKITKEISYTQSSRSFSVSNGEQAVAFELYRDAELIWFSNRFQFTVPDYVNIDAAKLFAVQADGKRIAASRK